eukprot:jgi/Botrbrau1/20790/Bobra.0156s0020.1
MTGEHECLSVLQNAMNGRVVGQFLLLTSACLLPIAYGSVDLDAHTYDESAISSVNRYNVQGRVLWPDELVTASQVQLILLLDGGERRTAWPKPDGSFIFYNIPAGPHMLETVAASLVYPQIHIDVDDDYGGSINAWYAEQPTMQLKPFLLRPIHKAEYFEVKQPFNVIAFLRTPYGMMIAVGLIAVFILPKLRVDPEEYREMMENRDAALRGRNRREVEQRPPQQRITSGASGSQGGAPTRRRRE